MSERFGRVPLRAASKGLPGSALQVLIAICAHADRRGYAYPSLGTIAALTGIARHNVPRATKPLIAEGLIIREKRGYRVVLDDGGVINPESITAESITAESITAEDGVLSPVITSVISPESPILTDQQHTKEQKGPPAAKTDQRSHDAPLPKYAFHGDIIRLTQTNLDRWRESFSAIDDLTAELRTIDAKFVDDGVTDKWFGKAAAWLRAKNERIRQERKSRDGSSWGAPGFA
jgi:hypothetical protein